MMNNRELINKLENLLLNSSRKGRTCAYPGCNGKTANNHCVSRALMSTFAHQGHVRNLVVNPWIEGGLAFNRTGMKDVSIFQGLCSYHDNKIFNAVDRSEINVKNYNNQILLTYRALLREKLTKIVKRESYNIFSKENKPIFNETVYLTGLHGGQFDYNLLSVAWYEQELLDEITSVNKRFVFKIIEFPFFELAGSELFSFEPDEITHLKRANYNRLKIFDAFAEIFVHLIPSRKNNKLYTIIGVHQKDRFLLNVFCKNLKRMDRLKALSDLLFLHVDGWVCSEMFYKTYLDGHVDELVKIFHETAAFAVPSRSTTYNLFQQG